MKPGDLIQLSHTATMCDSQEDIIGSGIMIKRLAHPSLPAAWPRILVLWNDGKLEQMHEEDLEAIR